MYKVGDKIVYPMHGAGVIEDIEEMDIFDKKQTYYKVTIASEGMEILIPVDKADEVGLRDIPNHEDIKKMFEVLGQPQDRMTSNWSKRYQDNMDQMKTGDLLDVARVTRNLMIMDRKKGLSSGDKKMLMTAKNFLISELMVVEHTEKEDECLYVFAENALPASSKEYVDALTKEKQQADIDAKIVEHYLTILERLEKTYA